MPVVFTPNPAGIARMSRDNEFRSFMERVAREMEQEAQAIAPVSTGAYRESLRGVAEMGRDGWEAKLTTDSPYWPFLEFGTSDTPMFATLRTTLSMVRV